MLERFLPNETVDTVFDIHLENLKEKGIKGIITDLDNTLIAWDKPYATPELETWFKKVKEMDLKLIIASNNNEQRVGEFANPLNIPFIHLARKPLKKGYMRALKDLNLSAHETVMIGDQLMTDILGGNSVGLYTILVVPIVKTDGLWTRFNRMMERRILKKLKKKGLM